ncbi:ATP-binding protein [Castellaniella sp.]|uniref:ATP-binding protein n=1 Tax=Castellaniella sp. TaxID=1955812 RepID=UPI002AFFC9A4|nr:ATP-binding protein [Castellaniella sp.]
MFHLQSLELLQWDYCQRLTLPLDGAIITVAGPNGSGKTTLLDAMRTLLGLDCSGGRNYKTYARHANADTTWLRAVVDNRPHTRQTSSRPFARNLLYADQVTLACRIDRNGGDWQRRYLMADGDVPIETLIQSPDKDWLGIEHWRKRLEGAGLSRAIARVLALEQGQTDRLCEYSPKELLRLVFDVFGDQEVLDRYEEARRHLRDQQAEVELAERELAHVRAQLAELEARVNLYRQHQHKLRERETLVTEVVPVLDWHETRSDIASRLAELHRQRLHQSGLRQQRSQDRQRLLQLLDERQALDVRVRQLEQARNQALLDQQQAREAERPIEDLVRQAEELQKLAAIEGDSAQLAERVRELERQKAELSGRWHALSTQRSQLQADLDGLQGQQQSPTPPDVQRFQRLLRQQNIAHHLMADVIDITDARWRAAAEGVLRAARWVVVLHTAGDEGRAMALAEKERYRHYLVAESAPAPAQPPPDSLLAVLRFSNTAPAWLLQQLAQIRRVDSTQDGTRQSGEWITPDAYWRDRRGGRSVWIDPAQHQFGAAALSARTDALRQQVTRLDQQLTELARQEQALRRQLDAARQAGQGRQAAQELAEHSEAFERARQQWPALKQVRLAASEHWTALEAELKQAIITQTKTGGRYDALQLRLSDGERDAERAERDWQDRRQEQQGRAAVSRRQKHDFPTSWITPDKIRSLLEHYQYARQARLRCESVERELQEGQWETDATVEDKQVLMQATVGDQESRLSTCKARNAAATTAVSNARERYIDVLRTTVRRYRRNITELGTLAGVEVSADMPHLDNDDTVLRQAELKVSFNFDGKGRIGLNDGEASGGQQVIKSLILLVGLLKDDDMSGGFVFIDEPFAHLDVRNIQLVGHFLKSTRAQYVLTTPITHNVEVFEPADITLVTSKKPPDARWAPPIGVLQRRAEPVT